jgi:4-hydroxy-3-polyprenylbenzoate decarboxylase
VFRRPPCACAYPVGVIARDLREWVDLLRREGELAEVEQEVDPYLEITEIADRAMKGGGPALLFKRVKGSPHPLLINQFGTERRMCLAFGVHQLDDVARKLSDVLELTPPQGLADKLRTLGKLKSFADALPKTVKSAPCQEVVLDQPSLDQLPIMTCWPDDGGPFITLPSVITKDPQTGGRNVGMYRLQKHGPQRLGMHWQIHKDAAADWRLGTGRMEVAVALGCDPVTTYASSAPLPKHIDEIMVSGFLRGEPVELVQCRTVDLQVPARAEMVIEGYCERGELEPEGPFGDHTGYYTPVEPFPVLNVTAVTMRRDAIYPSIIVGPPPMEDVWLGKATERIFLPAIRTTVPEIVDYDLPFAGVFHNCCIVSIRKAYPGHARKVMHAIWGLGLLSLTKAVVVVDAHVDVHDYNEVMWQVGANVDFSRDLEVASGPLDQLDHAAQIPMLGGKVGIDATATWREEGYTREWPQIARMREDVVQRIDQLWPALGIELSRRDGKPSTNGDRRPARRRALPWRR